MSQDTIRLLIINDDASEVDRLLSMLRNAGRTTRAQHVPSLEGLEKLLSDQAWDLLLAAENATSCDPKQALRVIKKLDKDVPAIFLSEVEPEEMSMSIIDGLKNGARDVVILDDDQHLLLVIARELANREERSAQRLANRKLKEVEKRCQQLLDSSRDAIAYVEDGMFLYLNTSFAERFGYSDPDEMLVVPVIDLIGSADQETYKQFMKDFRLTNDGSQELALNGLHQSKGPFPITLTVSHATFENEECVQLHVAAREGIDNEELQKQLKQASSLDPITGLYNRIYLQDALARAVSDAAEKDIYSSLHVISINGYDDLRASVGSSGRDAAMADLARVLKSLTDGAGILGRSSDEEFHFLTKGTDEAQQTALATKIFEAINNHICDAGGKSVQVTASIGICPITEKTTHPDQVIERSHIALDEVRQASKTGGVKYYIAKMGDAAGCENDALLAEIIDRAITGNTMELRYQAIVSMNFDGSEQYDIKLELPPSESGQVVEWSDIHRALQHYPELAIKVDRWKILNAAKAIATHREQGHPNTRFFINISSASLRDESLPGWLGVVLKRAEIPAQALTVQFPESDAAQYLTQSKAMVNQMKEQGISTCLNEFGSGLDPFKTLSHLPVDTVKIDRSFALDVQLKGEAPTAMKELLSQLKEQGFKTIVPGVQSPSLLATLYTATNYAQGNFFHPSSKEMNFNFSDDS